MWIANRFSKGKVENVSFKVGEGISGLLAQNGKSILVKDINKDGRYLHYAFLI
jgi:putative methionine-R-sulfoxide reductase with GAF domain